MFILSISAEIFSHHAHSMLFFETTVCLLSPAIALLWVVQ